MTKSVVIRKYAYLKNVRYSYSIENRLGGSFTMSDYRSLKAVKTAIAKHNGGNYRKATLETWTGFDEANKPVIETSEIDL